MKTLLRLFFDDGSLALTILALLAISALAIGTGWQGEHTVLIVLAVAIIVALIENVVRSARGASRN